ncbi:cyclin-Q isoform X1 [Microplitis mediator]|uniref:cyclin-Q isoform X1 n=2 Tax=Microplitis mediator TaxID=375433 RepID=UPI0025571BB2|nr:cyclin-Q isoform X1 [Microplitis mediator]
MNPSEPISTEVLSSKMKDVIDVLAMQREKRNALQKSVTIDYTISNDSFAISRFIYECGIKLDAHPLTIATASTLFHRFLREVNPQSYDLYLMATTCLYLAGKIKDDGLKIRDVMNVSSNTLHRGSQPLELGDQYWSIRDAIIQAELLIMRTLKFQVVSVHPHKYLLHYLRSLQAWFGEDEWSKYPVAKTSLALLQDFHHSPAILDYPPNCIALACINLTLQVYGVVVPLMDECDQLPWFNVFCKELTREKLWEIMEKVMSTYDPEPETQDSC